MSDLQNAFDKLIAEQRELQKKFQETAQALFKETTKEFFDKNPKVTAIVWTQYTPYFNDGDTCTFGVNEASFTNAPDPENVRWGEYNGDEETAEDGSEIFVYDCYGQAPEGVDKALCDKFSRLIQSSEMDSVMQAMFDDHVQVIATREGFDVEEYDHD
jgi:hypothetical protein